MTNSPELIRFLHLILILFVLGNAILSFVLYKVTHLKKSLNISKLFFLTIAIFFLGGISEGNPLLNVIAFSISIIPLTVTIQILFDEINYHIPKLKICLLYATFVIPTTMLLKHFGFSYAVLSIPSSLGGTLLLLHGGITGLRHQKRNNRILNIFLSLHLILGAVVHASYPLTKIYPEFSIYGWVMAFMAYNLCAFIYLALTIETLFRRENERLAKAVDERTYDLLIANKELQSFNSERTKLLKSLIHDISNPLQLVQLAATVLKRKLPEEEHDKYFQKISRGIQGIVEITREIRIKEKARVNDRSKNMLEEVNLDQCFSEVQEIFAERLNAKRMILTVDNQVNNGSKVLANKISIIHSVFNNLVSNAIKFSLPHSEIRLSAKEVNQQIEVKITDTGVGVSEQRLKKIFSQQYAISTEGTEGEEGTGFGLTQAKDYVEINFQGSFDIKSKEISEHPTAHGTEVTIQLNKTNDLTTDHEIHLQ